MKAARIHGYNAAPVIDDVPVPVIGPTEVLVRVTAVGLNPLDVKLQKGVVHKFFPLAFPYTLGTDLAGTVEELGSEVTGWGKGDGVIARVEPTSGGALAEFAAVPAAQLAKPPVSVTLEQAASIGTTAGTAWQALFESADVKPGQTILVHAAAGGVGSFAIQFARAAGARVIATASGDGVEIARRLGADQVIDYRAGSFADRLSDIDVVLDTIGGETQQNSFGILRAGGCLLSIASPPDDALAKAHNVIVKFVFHMSDANRLTKIVESIDAGTKILIDRTFPLGRLDDAFSRQASGRARGKIIVAL